MFLDPVTRAWRGDGGHVVEDIQFTLTVPDDPRPGPMPVVIFGHGLVTERRFVLAVGDALAAKGFAAISIDFPYHGARTYCAKGGPISLVNPLDRQPGLAQPVPGRHHLQRPRQVRRCARATATSSRRSAVIDLPVASGAVFLEIEHIANSKDHFQQALVDLGALDRSLRTGDWQDVLGRPVDTSRIFYAGQSLGGIMGAVFLGTDPDIQRAVLNVPGADLVPMFDDSTFFGAQLDAFFTRAEHRARQLRGPAVPRRRAAGSWTRSIRSTSAPITGDRALLIQMATLDFIIPNANTKIARDGDRRAAPRLPRRARLHHDPARARVLPRRRASSPSFLSGEL